MLLCDTFNYGQKEARVMSLNNIRPDSIFYNSMGWGITCFSFFLKGDNHLLPQHEGDGFSLIIIAPVGVEKS